MPWSCHHRISAGLNSICMSHQLTKPYSVMQSQAFRLSQESMSCGSGTHCLGFSAEVVVATECYAAECYTFLTFCRDVANNHNGRSSRDYRSHHHTSRHGEVDKHQGSRDSSYRGRERDSRGSSRDTSYRCTCWHFPPCQDICLGVTLYQNESMVTA